MVVQLKMVLLQQQTFPGPCERLANKRMWIRGRMGEYQLSMNTKMNMNESLYFLNSPHAPTIPSSLELGCASTFCDSKDTPYRLASQAFMTTVLSIECFTYTNHDITCAPHTLLTSLFLHRIRVTVF
jgi:hypothetical protein